MKKLICYIYKKKIDSAESCTNLFQYSEVVFNSFAAQENHTSPKKTYIHKFSHKGYTPSWKQK